jgi:hypothetical protein
MQIPTSVLMSRQLAEDCAKGRVTATEYSFRRTAVYKQVEREIRERHREISHDENSCFMCAEEKREVMDSAVLVISSGQKVEKARGISV